VKYLLVAVVLTAGLMGCARGSYPLDIFREMHYQQTYRPQEPDRPNAPVGAVPYYAQSGVKASGEQLFKVNCAMCHGETGRGDGEVLKILTTTYKYTPVLELNLKSDAVQGKSDEQLLQIISRGVQIMPSFVKLLTEEERRALVQYIRQLP
jgi:mono/diheme cytochrome c family protein